jgi:hypothetical protein
MKAELIDIVAKLKEYDIEQVAYLDSLPVDISSAFFDNKYTNALSAQRDLLIKALFGDMSEDIEWFLYEFEAGKSPGPHCILANGKAYTFKTNEDYYNYLEEQDE